MPTPSSFRAPPPRFFKNYILTKEIGTGLANINESLLKPIPDLPGLPAYDDVESSELDIGFQFELNGVKYSKFVVSTNGWLVLVDPGYSFNLTHILSSTSNANWSINSDFGGKQHLLLAPWFDDLKNKFDLSLGFTYDQQDKISKGIDPFPDRKSTRLNSSHVSESRMPSSA